MEVPEKIYLVQLPNGRFDREWFVNTIHSEDIEYTRTDTFIDKACKWLEFGDFFIENYLINDVDGNPDFQYEKFINDFKKAMEEL